MGERLIVSGSDELREYSLAGEMRRPDWRRAQSDAHLRGEGSLPGTSPGRRIRLEGSGALCAAGNSVFCACDWGDVIWRLDGGMLVPTGLFAGGPGMCDLLLSPDGERLYALCADADSLLALSATSGAPLMVNRVGVNPRSVSMDESGEVLAVAGGECASAVLLCARTLRVLGQIPMPGIVYSVALCAGRVHALCLNDSLGSTLTTVLPGGVRQTLRLCGMPGLLLRGRRDLLAATHEHIYAISPDGTRILRERDAAGRAGRLFEREDGMILHDSLSESVFSMSERSGRWRLIAEEARDATLLCLPDEGKQA